MSGRVCLAEGQSLDQRLRRESMLRIVTSFFVCLDIWDQTPDVMLRCAFLRRGLPRGGVCLEEGPLEEGLASRRASRRCLPRGGTCLEV